MLISLVNITNNIQIYTNFLLDIECMKNKRSCDAQKNEP